MSDERVYEVGRLLDLDGVAVVIGVDYDCVTIRSGHFRLTDAQAEEFANMFAQARWLATGKWPDSAWTKERVKF